MVVSTGMANYMKMVNIKDCYSSVETIKIIKLTDISLFKFYFSFLLIRNNTHILGTNNSNVPKLLGIIGDVVAHNTLSDGEHVLQRLLAIARHIQV